MAADETTPARKSINLSSDYVTRFQTIVGRSRTVVGAMSGMIDWIERQPAELRSVIFDGMPSPDVEAQILDQVADAARKRSGKPTRADSIKLALEGAIYGESVDQVEEIAKLNVDEALKLARLALDHATKLSRSRSEELKRLKGKAK